MGRFLRIVLARLLGFFSRSEESRRLRREISLLQEEKRSLEATIRVQEKEINKSAEVITRDRERILAETAAYSRKVPPVGTVAAPGKLDGYSFQE